MKKVIAINFLLNILNNCYSCEDIVIPAQAGISSSLFKQKNPLFVKFRIATRKSGCKSGIGFRCGNDLPELKTTDIDLEDEKTFSTKVSYDYKNEYVIYQFNQINWNEL